MLLKVVTVTITEEYYYVESSIYPGETIDERINEGICFDWSEDIQRTIVSKEIVI